MRRGGGKEKGRTFEVQAAKAVGKWWCQDEDAFWRNVSSGGRVHKVATPYSGDICPVKDNAKPWRLHIECKKREDWSFEGIVKQNLSEPLWEFIAQTEYDCHLSKRVGLLIFTRNRDEWYTYLPASSWFTEPNRAKFTSQYSRLYIAPSWEILKRFKEKYKTALSLTGDVVSWEAFTKYYSRENLKSWLKAVSKRLRAMEPKK